MAEVEYPLFVFEFAGEPDASIEVMESLRHGRPGIASLDATVPPDATNLADSIKFIRNNEHYNLAFVLGEQIEPAVKKVSGAELAVRFLIAPNGDVPIESDALVFTKEETFKIGQTALEEGRQVLFDPVRYDMKEANTLFSETLRATRFHYLQAHNHRIPGLSFVERRPRWRR